MGHPYVLTFTCADQSGIIHAITGAILEVGGNIIEQAQFTDVGSGLFCLRTRFESSEPDVALVHESLVRGTARFEPAITLRAEGTRRRILIMVSKADHCLVDLLYRHETGELPVDIPLVVSNHGDCRAQAERHGIPFVHLPVTPETKRSQEDVLLGLVDEHAIDVVVLARYMQVLSDDVCRALPGRIINIHHSFLPAFPGGDPYQQAYTHGVKLIGATAHYVTAELDQGPIIEQDTARVSHRHSVDDLKRLGRDMERQVLARAVRWHVEDRIIVDGNKTVVFS